MCLKGGKRLNGEEASILGQGDGSVLYIYASILNYLFIYLFGRAGS